MQRWMHGVTSVVRRLSLAVRAARQAMRCAEWTRAQRVQLPADGLLTLVRVRACCAVWAAQVGQM
eukprot:2804574-Pleurochrysis_carterae.AAC.1